MSDHAEREAQRVRDNPTAGSKVDTAPEGAE